MTDNPDTPALQVPELSNPGSDNVPIVYFDGVAALGTLNGAIEIELAARTIAPTTDGGTKVYRIATAHLRCSPAAAADLRNSIDKAFLLLAPTPEGKAN